MKPMEQGDITEWTFEEAIRKGRNDIVLSLLESVAPLNHDDRRRMVTERKGPTPLQLAVKYDNLDAAILCLKHGGSESVNTTFDFWWRPPIFEARSVAITELLLQYGADPDMEHHQSTPIESHASAGRLSVLKILIGYDDDKPEDFDVLAKYDAFALDNPLSRAMDLAVLAGHPHIDDFLNSFDVGRTTYLVPSDFSSRFGGSEPWDDTSRRLADDDFRRRFDEGHILHYLADAGDALSIIELMTYEPVHLDIETYDEDDDAHGWTALHLAARKGHLDVIEFLLDPGKSDHFQDLMGSTEIEVEGATIDSETEDNDTPLEIAALHGHLEVVRILVEAGADIEHSYNGFSPLSYAIGAGHSEIARYLTDRSRN